MLSLKRLIEFIKLTHKFQQVKRVVLIKNEDRWENDFEHSYQLGIVAWYIVHTNKLDLDLNLVIKYALVHDWPEVYAGDVNFYDLKKRKNKQKREQKAIKRLQRELPEFGEMYKIIEVYEKKQDRESRFVYALDKILPILNIYLDKGRTWKANGITLEMLTTHKTAPVSLDKEIQKYFEAIITDLKKHKDYFPQASD